MEESTLDFFKRLSACHQNGLESLALFAGGVAVSAATGVPERRMDICATVHIAARVVFSIVYAAPPFAWGLPRTAAWGVSVAASNALWVSAYIALT